MKLGARLREASLNTWIRVGIGVAIVFAFFLNEFGTVQSRFMQQLELWTYDARLRFFMPRTLDPRIVIVDIDEKSLIAEGRWPWSRDKMALLLERMFERYKVKVVGFDVAFPEPDPSSGLARLEALAKEELRDNVAFRDFLQRHRAALDYDRLFADAVGKYPVVLGFFFGAKEQAAGVLPPPIFTLADLKSSKDLQHIESAGYSANIALLQEKATAAGHVYPNPDFDGITRRVPLMVGHKNGFYEAMSVALTRVALGDVPLVARTDDLGGPAQFWDSLQIGPLQIPLDEHGNALIPYRGAGGSFRYVSATEVLRGTAPADQLDGKIVIVGTSALGLLDLRATPVDETFPGVEIHANLVSGFLDQKIMHRPQQAQTLAVLIVLLVGLPFAVLLPRFSATTATGVVVALVVVLIAINLYAWKGHHYVLSFAAPLLMLAMLYFVNMAYGFFMETRSRRLITGLFGTYVPKELVAQMSKNPEEYSMRGESREMTVLFSDVRDFTSISEGLSPEGLKDMMNTYLTAMTEVIQERRGTIDKYIGDAIMAFWGAPLADADHARHALDAALAMQKRIRALDPEFARRGWPMLHIGVGLNCGVMNVGDMGSRFRRAYTVIGDAVNLSSRLEGLTKEYGVPILVSENIVANAPGFVYREVDRVVVKGRHEGISIQEPLGRLGEVDDALLEEVDLFHKVLEHYRAQRWDEAERLLSILAEASPDTKLYKVYRQRIFQFRYNPPGPGWNGTWVFTTK
jgi:adenylate cyclase